MSRITCDLRELFCASASMPQIVPGASRSGIEAVLNSLIEPGDRVVVGVYGHFGELLCTLASRHGAEVVRVDAEWGQIVEPASMIQAIRAHRPKLAAIVHADTSTGIVQPLEDIGRACAESGTVLVVDAVLSIGGCEVNVDGWRIDAAIGGLQKCIGGPPGLAPTVLSSRALDAMRARKSRPRSRYLDLPRLLDASDEVPTPMIYALAEALKAIADEGLRNRWQRHLDASRHLRAGLLAMGVLLFADQQHRVPMITLVQVPDGLDEAEVRQQLLEQHGVEIMAAFGPLRGKVWRIGTMGVNASLPSVLQVLGALGTVLAARGVRVNRGAAVDAALQA